MSLPEIVVTSRDVCSYILKYGRGIDVAEEVDIVGPFDHVISIVGTWEGEYDPPGGWEVWNAYPARKLRLIFDDVQKSNLHGDAPTKEDVQQIIEFARGIDSGRVIIHCAAGISRSSAAALTVLGTLVSDADAAVKHLCSIRKAGTIYPHANLVRMADDLLGYDGRLTQARNAVWDPHS